MSYTHLWLDIVAGLKKEGWVTKGGNYTSFFNYGEKKENNKNIFTESQ